jgi:hypothetical protein
MGLTRLGLEVLISLYGVVILNEILRLDLFGLALSRPQACGRRTHRC